MEPHLNFFSPEEGGDHAEDFFLDQKSQAAKDNKEDHGHVQPNIFSVGNQIIGEKGEAGVAKSRDGVEKRQSHGPWPRKMPEKAEKKREAARQLDGDRIKKDISEERPKIFDP